MKRFPIVLFVIAMSCASCNRPEASAQKDYPILPVDFTRVELREGFWKTWTETARNATIPYAFGKCEETGRIDNFVFAAGIREGRFRGRFGFDDSDVYKIMEGASYALMLERDPDLEAYLDTLIGYLSGAQEEDGYLYTSWTLKANDYTDFACCSYSEEGQWKGTSGASHELYNAGHMYEAAVAHALATGKETFLDIAVKNADLVYRVCIEEGNPYVPGHQEIELGLVKLFRLTGEPKYLELARHFLDLRAEVKDDPYSQSHLPVTEQREAVGHAVRANYMYAAMTDIAALTGDSAYRQAVRHLWENVVGKKLSVTGGVGASHRGEAYGENYELPNDPYNETCAAIANVYWNHRMFLLSGEPGYMDVLERSLYNGVLPGISLEGTRFFYPNTLRHDGQQGFNRGAHTRSPWFDCSCCPSNLSRFIPSVAGYAYGMKEEEVFVNLYMEGEARLPLEPGSLTLVTRTRYPWDGRVEMEVRSERPVQTAIHLRIPGWAREQPVPSDLFRFRDPAGEAPALAVNGERLDLPWKEGYMTVERRWKNGDRLVLELPMKPRILTAHPRVKEKEGLIAVQYGPLVYCAEETDNAVDVIETPLSPDTPFAVRFDAGLLGGVNLLEGGDRTLVPYYAWANRGPGKMNVWFATAVPKRE